MSRPKQSLEIEGVVLYRVEFLEYFCPEQTYLPPSPGISSQVSQVTQSKYKDMDEKNGHLLKPKKYENYENSEVRSIPLGKLGEKQGTLGICRWRVLLGTCKFWKTHEDIQFTTSDCRLGIRNTFPIDIPYKIRNCAHFFCMMSRSPIVYQIRLYPQ